MLEIYQGKLNGKKCFIGSGRKIFMFFFYKRCTVRRKPVIYGKMNGVTKSCENSRRAGVAILFTVDFGVVYTPGFFDMIRKL